MPAFIAGYYRAANRQPIDADHRKFPAKERGLRERQKKKNQKQVLRP
jgi:hypothetical protein